MASTCCAFRRGMSFAIRMKLQMRLSDYAPATTSPPLNLRSMVPLPTSFARREQRRNDNRIFRDAAGEEAFAERRHAGLAGWDASKRRRRDSSGGLAASIARRAR